MLAYYHSGGDCTSSTPPKTWKWLGEIWYEKHDDHRMGDGIVILTRMQRGYLIDITMGSLHSNVH